MAVSLGGNTILTNVGSAYDSIAAAKGLGIAIVDFTGVARVDFSVFCNKVGTGTISWQLWNQTDGSQILVIDDAAAAADNKLLTTNITSGIPTGVKTVRVRCKSTVAADDPVMYGAAILLS